MQFAFSSFPGRLPVLKQGLVQLKGFQVCGGAERQWGLECGAQRWTLPGGAAGAAGAMGGRAAAAQPASSPRVWLGCLPWAFHAKCSFFSDYYACHFKILGKIFMSSFVITHFDTCFCRHFHGLPFNCMRRFKMSI